MSELARAAISEISSGNAVRPEDAAFATSAPTAVDDLSSGWPSVLQELAAFAVESPAAALERARQIADKHERKAAAGVVCKVIAENDPQSAFIAAWNFDLGKFANDDNEGGTLEHLARRWASADPGAAIIWITSQPLDEEGRRDRVIKGITASIAQDDPSIAAKIISATGSLENNVRTETVVDLLRHWAPHDYDSAAAWVDSLPAGVAKHRSMEELAAVKPDTHFLHAR